MSASKGPSTRVNFNIGVAGEAGSGRQTFIKSLTSGYDSDKHDFCIRIIGKKFLTEESLTKRHLDWLDGYGIPVSEEVQNIRDERVHCIFYLFSPHRVLSQHKRKLAKLSGLAPIIPIVSKADMLTAQERTQQLQAVHQLMTEVTENSAYPTFFDFGETAAPVVPVVELTSPSECASEEQKIDEVLDESRSTPQNPTNTPISAEDVDCDGSVSSESGVLVGESDESAHPAEDSPGPTEPEQNVPNDTTETVEPPATAPQAPATTPALPWPSSAPSPSFNESLSRLHAHLSKVVPLVTRAALQAKHWKSVAQTNLSTSTHSSSPTNTHPSTQPSTRPHSHATPFDIPSKRNIFAVVCAKSASGLREYPWGSVDPRDESVSDLCRLRRLVFECGSINRLRALTQEFSIRLYYEQHRAQSQRDAQMRHKANERRDWQWRMLVGFVFLCMSVMYAVNLAVLANVVNREPYVITTTYCTNTTTPADVTNVITPPVPHCCASTGEVLTVGARVMVTCACLGSERWSTGVVNTVHSNGSIDIIYDLGDKKNFIPTVRIREVSGDC